MDASVLQMSPTLRRALFNQFRGGKSIFDLSLDYGLPYSEIERIVRWGIDIMGRQTGNSSRGRRGLVLPLAEARLGAAETPHS